MEKLTLRPMGITRLLIAGLMAWALVLSGMTAAARSHGMDRGVAPLDVGDCGGLDDVHDHRHSPGPHFSCSCCVPCRSGQLDGPQETLSAIPIALGLSILAASFARGDVFPIVEQSSPAGWISSWSSRAPPVG